MLFAKIGANPAQLVYRFLRMIRHFPSWYGLTMALCLAGCQGAILPRAPVVADLGAQTVTGPRPTGPEGACWASDETPAVIETVTEQIAEQATAETDAGFRTETSQEIVKPREQIWFRTPCDADLTPEVLTTLQRALAVRGFYVGEPTGSFDPGTRRAIRAFQLQRGLNSDRLSLAAARDLGVIASDFGQIKPAQATP
jgi:hypothetical protein